MADKERITNSESLALSVIRVFAMVLIVSCHIAQCYELQIAFLLNIGVQIFFFMSGFLYGRLDITGSPFSFYKKRFVKVYLPYYIILAIVIVIYAVFRLYKFNAKQILLYLLNLQWFSTPIDGLNHLWFLTVLMVGYLLTPWVKRLLDKHPVWFILVFVVCCVAEFVLVKKFYSFCAWVALYFAGMLFGHYYSKKTSNLVLLVSSIVLAILLVLFKPEWLSQDEFVHHTIWFHWVLGLFLFVSLFRLLPLIVKSEKKHSLIKHLDSISYEVYLVHHPLILGPLSMMFVTKFAWLNVLIMLLAVYVLSRALHYICSFTKSLV